jgi:hypothetical protein
MVYVLGLAAICWAIWKARNRTCFEKKPIKSPLDVLYSGCVFLQYWAGLYSEKMKPMIMAGVETLISIATKIAKKEEQDGRRCIEPAGVQPNDTSKQFEAEDQDAQGGDGMGVDAK